MVIGCDRGGPDLPALVQHHPRKMNMLKYRDGAMTELPRAIEWLLRAVITAQLIASEIVDRLLDAIPECLTRD